eukprot:maker-scaffold1331_size47282-snap-gene-0.7 protein:Tk00448 transcript:maker-scaffold1331_size47282-snap-gene-0.7-mRNA-1 annotation:"PREDICTED: hypothetical protein LOC100647418 isoform 1"
MVLLLSTLLSQLSRRTRPRSGSSHWAMAGEQRQHVIAGCWLSPLLILPGFIPRHTPYWAFWGVLLGLYAFVVVPVSLAFYQLPYQTKIVRYFRPRIRRFLVSLREILRLLPSLLMTLCVALPQIYRVSPSVNIAISRLVFLALTNASGDVSKMIALDFFTCYEGCFFMAQYVSRCWHGTSWYDGVTAQKWNSPRTLIKLGLATGLLRYSVAKIATCSPTPSSIGLSMAYSVSTDPIVEKLLVRYFQAHRVQHLEDLEAFYVPISLKVLQIVSSLVLCTRLPWTDFPFLVLSLYTCVYVPWEQTVIHLIRPLQKELGVLAHIPRATPEEVAQFSDATCPICLDELHVARITHCRHIFHSMCLRKSLEVTNRCPICRRSVMIS